MYLNGVQVESFEAEARRIFLHTSVSWAQKLSAQRAFLCIRLRTRVHWRLEGPAEKRQVVARVLRACDDLRCFKTFK